MDFVGRFHLEKNDGNLFLVYHQFIFPEIPFICPILRFQDESKIDRDHHVLPLYSCNNKEFDANGGCGVCKGANFGTYYYFCESHLEIYHKECVESPHKINHPYHPQHPLENYFVKRVNEWVECLCCGRICCGIDAHHMVYYCPICNVYMHPICAMKTIPFVIDPPKRHDHPLSFFPRQTSLTCNICGWLRKYYPTYICVGCNFVAHIDCMHSPQIVKISRHHHRISYISSLQLGEWSCGICHQSIDCDYGAYTCEKCSDYIVHSRCALSKYVWDGEELEGVPEEDDITNDVESFNMISEELILHFLHDHQLLLKVNMIYEENKFCQACVLPIFKGNSYSCMKCDFFLHEPCAISPRIIQHALHPHPLTLRNGSSYNVGNVFCNACYCDFGGFVYECHIGECKFDLDLRCATISEPFAYVGHEHPLFLPINHIDKLICHVCKTECYKQLNCIICNFIVCMKCATLPSEVRYKHDKHYLTILYGEEICENNWCEVCERDLGDTDAKMFYGCNECCTTFHTKCLLGNDPYMKPGQFYSINGKEVQIVLQSNISRPLCDSCKNHCQDKIFKRDNRIACSVECACQIWERS